MFSKFAGSKVFYHLDHVKRTLEGERTFPVHINIHTTNYCNHRCVWCSAYESQKDKSNDQDFDVLVSAMRDATGLGLKAVTHIGNGDPTLYGRFRDLINVLHDAGLEQGILTHGGFPPSYRDDMIGAFTWIRFSLDAASAKTHEKVHGNEIPLADVACFDSVMDNIKALVDGRESPESLTIGVQFALHQENFHELGLAANMVKGLGADYFAVKPVYKIGAVGIRTSRYQLDWPQVLDEIKALEELNGDGFEILYKPYQFQVNNAPYYADGNQDLEPTFVRNYKKCYAANFEWWIENNFDVSVCHASKKIVGNLKEQTVKAILNSQRYGDVVDGINIEECFRGCRPHNMNEVLHALENPDFGIHKNFVG